MIKTKNVSYLVFWYVNYVLKRNNKLFNFWRPKKEYLIWDEESNPISFSWLTSIFPL